MTKPRYTPAVAKNRLSVGLSVDAPVKGPRKRKLPPGAFVLASKRSRLVFSDPKGHFMDLSERFYSFIEASSKPLNITSIVGMPCVRGSFRQFPMATIPVELGLTIRIGWQPKRRSRCSTNCFGEFRRWSNRLIGTGWNVGRTYWGSSLQAN